MGGIRICHRTCQMRAIWANLGFNKPDIGWVSVKRGVSMSLHSSEECRVAACLCHAQADASELGAIGDANAITLSRRGLLRAALTGTAAGVLAGTGLEVLA